MAKRKPTGHRWEKREVPDKHGKIVVLHICTKCKVMKCKVTMQQGCPESNR